MSKDITKPRPISGFSEWLPGARRLEQQWLDHIRRVFESYGYTNIETPAVEDINVLAAKGDITKEIYALHRHLAEHGDKDDARLALHFDLTVPLARYVAQNFNELDFPFKRYAMQKVWRGERPQKGRMREFYQCDIDVIGIDNLPLHFDAEMPAVMHEIFSGLGFNAQVRVSNRKILTGLMKMNGVSDTVTALQILDKMEKIGIEKTKQELTVLKIPTECIDYIIKIIQSKFPNETIGIADENNKFLFAFYDHEFLGELKQHRQTLDEGIAELSFVLDALKHLPPGAVVADLSITRGLDYYTGTVYETRLLDVPEFTGSVCSGGRYDDLAGRFINKHLPGVGISIGLSRLFEVLLDAGKITPLAPSPTDILILLNDEGQRAEAMVVASQLRERHNVEVAHTGDVKKSFKYAEKKQIPFVWLLPSDDRPHHSVKVLATGVQSLAAPADW